MPEAWPVTMASMISYTTVISGPPDNDIRAIVADVRNIVVGLGTGGVGVLYDS